MQLLILVLRIDRGKSHCTVGHFSLQIELGWRFSRRTTVLVFNLRLLNEFSMLFVFSEAKCFHLTSYVSAVSPRCD